MQIDPLDIIRKYYPEKGPLRRVLLTHSEQVCRRALLVAKCHPELSLDTDILRLGAMLHDIGIYLTHAPSIYCYGNEPYLMHGWLGGRIMRREHLPVIARICERHTGAGLTRDTIISEHLDMPAHDFLPESLEEQVICYADKFYSKSHLDRERTPQQAYQSLLPFGADGARRFQEWQEKFG